MSDEPSKPATVASWILAGFAAVLIVLDFFSCFKR